ncbi:MAG: DUF58 domain-containing protein [Gammaproteobacteria bacterium]|nr:DUF58 domain-containing protein [Gammaproteobacteria bacterium]
MRFSIKNYFRDKALQWAERRQGADPDPVTLHRRRVYILPTRAGVIYSFMLFAMLLGSMNYSNSMGFVLTFFLASLGLVAMHHCHRNLERLILRTGRVDSVFAGQTAVFHLIAHNDARAGRYGISVAREENVTARTDISAGGSAILSIPVETETRGIKKLGRVSVYTTYPFGLFRAWAWLRTDLACVVYPRPAEVRLPPPPSATENGVTQLDELGQDDFSGLRLYRSGDAPRHIAWKASARTQQDLLVKQFSSGGAATRWFEWDSLPKMDVEARLSMLCRWILDAHGAGDVYGLKLPQQTIELNQGLNHRNYCLKALALFQVESIRRAA